MSLRPESRGVSRLDRRVSVAPMTGLAGRAADNLEQVLAAECELPEVVKLEFTRALLGDKKPVPCHLRLLKGTAGALVGPWANRSATRNRCRLPTQLAVDIGGDRRTRTRSREELTGGTDGAH